MIVLGAAMILAGVGLFFASTVLLLRAYRGRRIPYRISNETMPESSNLMQLIGMLLIIATGFFVARELAPWNFLVLLLTAIAQFIIFAIHNRRVKAEQHVDDVE
ncbi:hypothetical protein ACI1US_00582 [Leucobacter sp. BZR 635]